MPLNPWAQNAYDFFSRAVVTQPFGPESAANIAAGIREPFFRAPGSAAPVRYHEGVDLAYPEGTAILSPEPYARVVFAGDAGDGYGNHVILSTPRGVQVLLGHMKSISVRTGQSISLGQEVGKVGSTGHSTGPHVHVEVRDEAARLVPISGNTTAAVVTRLSNLFGWQRDYSGQAGYPGPNTGQWTPGGGYSGPPVQGVLNTTAGQGGVPGPAPDPSPLPTPSPTPTPNPASDPRGTPDADGCYPGSKWNAQRSQCVDSSGNIVPRFVPQAGAGACDTFDIGCQLRTAARSFANWFTDVSVTLLWLALGAGLLWAGVRQLGRDPGTPGIVAGPARVASNIAAAPVKATKLAGKVAAFA